MTGGIEEFWARVIGCLLKFISQPLLAVTRNHGPRGATVNQGLRAACQTRPSCRHLFGLPPSKMLCIPHLLQVIDTFSFSFQLRCSLPTQSHVSSLAPAGGAREGLGQELRAEERWERRSAVGGEERSILDGE